MSDIILNLTSNDIMKELPANACLSATTQTAIDTFTKKITKRKEYYDKFHSVLINSFDQVLQEEINTCVCCGQEFVGKSIGPHYKNNKKCADFKRKKEGREGPEPIRQPLEPKEENEANPFIEAKVKVEQGISADQEVKVSKEEYDELNEYFDSF